MSSASDYNSSSPKREHLRQDNSRSRSRQRKQNREYRDRERDRKIKIKLPELTAPLYTFKHFSNLQGQRVPSETIQKGYQKYKRDWEQHQNEEFLKQYKKDPWFAQKYDPEVLDLLERDRKENCRKNHTEFINRFSQGFYDKIDLTVKDPSQLGVVQRIDEQDEQSSSLSYILNHTFEIHLNQQLDITREPIFAFDQDINTLFIKSVPRAISRYDIREIVQKLEGYKSLTMSDPVKKSNLARFCWIQFQNEETCNKAQLSLSGLMIKNETLVVSKSVTKIKRVKVLKNYPVSRIEKDIETLGRLIAKLDEEMGIQKNQLLFKQFNNSQSKMDVFLLYLRKVHAYDYYTNSQFDNERILSLKVCTAFLRMQADYDELQNAQTIYKKIQEKAEERIQKGSQIRDYMGILRQEIQAFIRESQKLSKDQQKEVWKCVYCDKKFKTCEFLAKHMIAKHEEIKFKKIQSVMEKLYLEDPQKITFASLGDRDQRSRKPFVVNYRKEKRREYRDFDDPDHQKRGRESTAGSGAVKQMVNFLDI